MNDDYDVWSKGLRPEIIEIVETKIKPEEGMIFVNLFLKDGLTYLHADTIREALKDYPWYPPKKKSERDSIQVRESQIRFTRVLRDWAIDNGYPICSTNDGYIYGDGKLMLEAANRAWGFAGGVSSRAEKLTYLAFQVLTPEEREKESARIKLRQKQIKIQKESQVMRRELKRLREKT